MNILILGYNGSFKNSLDIIALNQAIESIGGTCYVAINNCLNDKYNKDICKKIKKITYTELKELNPETKRIKEINFDYSIILDISIFQSVKQSNITYGVSANIFKKIHSILFIDDHQLNELTKSISTTSIINILKHFYKIYCSDIELCKKFSQTYCGLEIEYTYPLIKYIDDSIIKTIVNVNSDSKKYIDLAIINEKNKNSADGIIKKSNQPYIYTGNLLTCDDPIHNRTEFIKQLYNSSKVITDSEISLYLAIILNIPVKWVGDKNIFEKTLSPTHDDPNRSANILDNTKDIYHRNNIKLIFDLYRFNSVVEFGNVLTREFGYYKDISLVDFNLRKKDQLTNSKINVLIVHYNTPDITEKTIQSINKFVSRPINIYLFDNSNSKPFTYRQDNLIYIDNTKGQIINFDEWIKQYPNKIYSPYIGSNCGSAKHSYTIQKFIDMFDENFILMDSDVIVKKDFTEIWDENYLWVGTPLCGDNFNNDKYVNRVLPFLCFINKKLMNLYHIKYFEDAFICRLGIADDSKLFYDTGSSFYVNSITKKCNIKTVNIYEYISHLGHGSFDRNDYHILPGLTNVDEWLKSNKLYWGETSDKLIISMTTYPERLRSSIIVWDSILKQSIDRSLYDCCLVISKDEFPKGLDSETNEFFKKNNIEIIWDDGNQISHKKLIPTLIKYPNRPILCIDDDIYREDGWLQTFIDDHKKHNTDIIVGYSKYKLNETTNKFEELTESLVPGELYNNIRPANGFGGTLYPAYCFKSPEFYNRDIYMSLCPNSDEIWQFYFNVKEQRQFRMLSKTYNYRSNIIDLTQDNDKVLHIINGQKNYDQMYENICEYFK